MPFDCTIEQLGNVIVVAPEGEIDMTNASVLREVLRKVVESRTGGRIAVDMRNVTFLDSSGIGMLVAAHRAAAAKGVELTLADPNPVVRMTLDITNLTDVLVGDGIRPARTSAPSQPA